MVHKFSFEVEEKYELSRGYNFKSTRIVDLNGADIAHVKIQICAVQ
jgi:hypothetical protein